MISNKLVVQAARQGSHRILKVLLSLGASANSSDDSNRTALVYASQGFHGGHFKCAAMLLQAGSDVNAQDSHGETALMASCRCGRAGTIESLLRSGRCGVNVVNFKGHTALHLAVEHGQVGAVPVLISYDADVETQDKVDGTSPLMSAVQSGNRDVVKALLWAKADPNKHRRNGMTAIHIGCLNPHIDIHIVEELIHAGANVNGFDTLQMLPINYAAKHSRDDIVSELVKAKSLLDNPDPLNNCWTPLHFAVLYSPSEHVFLLLTSGANMDACSSDLLTPIDLAISADRPDVISAMLDLNCSLRRRHATRKGHVPMVTAATSGHSHLLGLLHWAGADIAPAELQRCFPLSSPSTAESSLDYFELNIKAFKHILDLIMQPRTLKDICRINIRCSLGRGLHEKLTSLRFPHILKAYIALSGF